VASLRFRRNTLSAWCGQFLSSMEVGDLTFVSVRQT
jgi:hypothetical protein